MPVSKSHKENIHTDTSHRVLQIKFAAIEIQPSKVLHCMYWMNHFCGFMNSFHFIKVITISKLMIMWIERFLSVSISALSRCFVPLNGCKRILNTCIINAKHERHVSKVALIDIISILTPCIEQPLYPECIFIIRMHGFKFKSMLWQYSKIFIFSHQTLFIQRSFMSVSGTANIVHIGKDSFSRNWRKII